MRLKNTVATIEIPHQRPKPFGLPRESETLRLRLYVDFGPRIDMPADDRNELMQDILDDAQIPVPYESQLGTVKYAGSWMTYHWTFREKEYPHQMFFENLPGDWPWYTVQLLHDQAADGPTDNPLVWVRAPNRDAVDFIAQQEAAALWARLSDGAGSWRTPEDHRQQEPDLFFVCSVFKGQLQAV